MSLCGAADCCGVFREIGLAVRGREEWEGVHERLISMNVSF